MPRNKSGSKHAVSRRFPTKTRNFRLKVTRKTKKSRKNNKTVKGGGLFNSTNINVEDLNDPNSRMSCICEKLLEILQTQTNYDENEPSRTASDEVLAYQIFASRTIHRKSLPSPQDKLFIDEIVKARKGINDVDAKSIATTLFQDPNTPPFNNTSKYTYKMTKVFEQIINNWKTDKDKPEYKNITEVTIDCNNMNKSYIIGNGIKTRFITYAITTAIAQDEIYKKKLADENALFEKYDINVEDLKDPNSRMTCICEKLLEILQTQTNYEWAEATKLDEHGIPIDDDFIVNRIIDSRIRAKLYFYKLPPHELSYIKKIVKARKGINDVDAIKIKNILFQDPNTSKNTYNMTDVFKIIIANWKIDMNKPEYKDITEFTIDCNYMNKSYIIGNGIKTRFITYALTTATATDEIYKKKLADEKNTQNNRLALNVTQVKDSDPITDVNNSEGEQPNSFDNASHIEGV